MPAVRFRAVRRAAAVPTAALASLAALAAVHRPAPLHAQAPPTATASDTGTAREARAPGVVVVVSEGEREARSLGSYALRVYQVVDSAHPYDRFTSGLVRHREGTVEAVRFTPLRPGGDPALVVFVRSVGTGGYRSAHAYRVRAGRVTPLHSVSGLAKDAADADVVRALAAGPGGRRAR